MAIEVKVLKVGSDVLTDIRPGRTRRTVYSPEGQLGPMTIFLLGLGTALIGPGIARAFTGTSPRAKAREALQDELLAAQITGAKAQADLVRANITRVSREFDPVSEEERALKLQATRDALDLADRQEPINLEAERLKAARADELFAQIQREKNAALLVQEDLAAERAERQAEFIATERTKRELAAEEADRSERSFEQCVKDNEEGRKRAWMDAPIGVASLPFRPLVCR